MAKTVKPLTKEALVSMQVVDAKGRLVGKVKDVAFTVGELGISLIVETEEAETESIPWQDIQAAADFILLKPAFRGGSQAQPEKKEEPSFSAAVATPIVAPMVVTPAEEPEETKPKEEAAPKKKSSQPLCPTCGKPLTWIPQYSRWYCYNDKKYVKSTESKKNDWEEVFQEQPKKEAKKPSAKQLCPTCGKPLTWIPQYSRWYCYNDKKYV